MIEVFMAAGNGKERKILIFEDDVVTSHLMLNIMSKAGYRAFMAKDGLEGIDIALKIKPDLILMDIEMPHLDGYETTQKMKSMPELAHIPVVFVSSKTSQEDAGKAFEFGGVSYLKKPIMPKQLNDVISLVFQTVV